MDWTKVSENVELRTRGIVRPGPCWSWRLEWACLTPKTARERSTREGLDGYNVIAWLKGRWNPRIVAISKSILADDV